MAESDFLYQQQVAQQQRRQQMAQMLFQQGLQQEPTQMVGGVAIRQSPWAALAKGLMAYQGIRGMDKADQALTDLATKRDATDSAAMQQGMDLLNKGDRSGAMNAFSASPRGQAYAAALLGSQLEKAPDKQRMFEYRNSLAPQQQQDFDKFLQLGETPYSTPIQTSTGFQQFNNRTGAVTPLMGTNGQPLMPVPADVGVQGRVAQAKAIGEGQGQAATIPLKAGATKAAEKQIEAQFTAPGALNLMNDWEKVIMRQPATALGRAAERTAGIAGLGNEDQQNAVAEGDTIASQLMAYAEKLPGPASDKDRIDFKASIGAYADPTATKAQRLAALRQARKSFERTVQKYGSGAPAAPGGTSSAQPQRLRFNPATGELE